MIKNESQKIELWYEPAREINGNKEFVCEMTEQNHAFISGIIKMKRPNKIVEIGVAEGGTTAVIMQTLSMLELESKVYSVDLNENFYYNNGLKTGYAFHEIKRLISLGKNEHQFMFGKTIAGQLELIGKGIDLVIIDTTHVLPGEILDFVAILPYLSKKAIVILHDVDVFWGRIINNELEAMEGVATRVLFISVLADRIVDNENEMCNIAAYQINEHTYKYIEGCFWALGLPWTSRLSIENLKEYRDCIERNYSDYYIDIFDVAVRTNLHMLAAKEKRESLNDKCFLVKDRVSNISRIALYGAGYCGKENYSLLKEIDGLEVTVWVDKRYKEYQKQGLNVVTPDRLATEEFDCIIIGVKNKELYKEIKTFLLTNKLNRGKNIYWTLV